MEFGDGDILNPDGSYYWQDIPTRDWKCDSCKQVGVNLVEGKPWCHKCWEIIQKIGDKNEKVS